jgi:hypothetical protein
MSDSLTSPLTQRLYVKIAATGPVPTSSIPTDSVGLPIDLTVDGQDLFLYASGIRTEPGQSELMTVVGESTTPYPDQFVNFGQGTYDAGGGKTFNFDEYTQVTVPANYVIPPDLRDGTALPPSDPITPPPAPPPLVGPPAPPLLVGPPAPPLLVGPPAPPLLVGPPAPPDAPLSPPTVGPPSPFPPTTQGPTPDDPPITGFFNSQGLFTDTATQQADDGLTDKIKEVTKDTSSDQLNGLAGHIIGVGELVEGALGAATGVTSAFKVGKDIAQISNDAENGNIDSYHLHVTNAIYDLTGAIAPYFVGGVLVATLGPTAAVVAAGAVSGAVIGLGAGWLVSAAVNTAIDLGHNPLPSFLQPVGHLENAIRLGSGLLISPPLSAPPAVPTIPTVTSTDPANPSPTFDDLYLPAGTTPTDPHYMNASGSLISQTGFSPIKPGGAPVDPIRTQLTSAGTYTINAETIGTDIANVFISSSNNGFNGVVGVHETIKLAADLNASPVDLSTVSSINTLAITVGVDLGGSLTATNEAPLYIAQMLKNDLAGTVPTPAASQLQSYLTTKVFGDQGAPGTIGAFLTDLTHGMPAGAAFTAETGKPATFG